jgi:galactonate dehydratase
MTWKPAVPDLIGRFQGDDPVKITKLDTIRIAKFPQLIWIQIHTDEGLVGLGETFFNASAVEAYLHDDVSPRILGRDPLAIDAIARDLVGYLGFRSTGVEVRAASAVDIALWDLFGKAVGMPIVQLLGGWTRDRIRTYNTCAGDHYMRKAETQSTTNWGTNNHPTTAEVTGFDDLNDFLNRADELAESILADGITAMKIWPFDMAAEKTDGHYISSEDLRKALEPFEKIRKRIGDRIDIMVEFHSLWQLLPAMKIAKALGPFGTFWHEDPIKMDSLGSLKRYAAISPAPICASETLGSRWAFRDLLQTEAVGVVMLDLAWCGGLSEGRKIAAMAEAWHLSVAPHDCTGPVVFAASTHLSLNAPNALVQESVRAFYNGWYANVMTALPKVKDGFVTVPEGPGLGCELLPDIDNRFSVSRRSSLAN